MKRPPIPLSITETCYHCQRNYRPIATSSPITTSKTVGNPFAEGLRRLINN
jgi:hypothetical protein